MNSDFPNSVVFHVSRNVPIKSISMHSGTEWAVGRHGLVRQCRPQSCKCFISRRSHYSDFTNSVLFHVSRNVRIKVHFNAQWPRVGSRQTWAGQGSAGPNLVSVSLAGEAITSIWRRWHGNYLFVNRHQVTLGYFTNICLA